MTDAHLLINLREHEDAALITVDGELKHGVVHQRNDLVSNGDAIHALMIEIMKNPEAHEGIWLWKITDEWSCVRGYEIMQDEEPE